MKYTPGRDISIYQAVKEYLDHKASLGKLSDASIKNRRIELSRFCSFCRKQGFDKPHQLHKNHLKAYFSKLKVSNGTKATLILIYRSFFDYLVTEDIVLDNIAANIELPKTNNVDPDFLTLEELEKVFRREAENAGAKFVDRNLLLFSIMIEIGLRVSTIVNLKVVDVRLDAKQLWIRQKGGSQKLVPITDDIVSQFKTWYSVRESFKNADACEFVFMASTGRQLKRQQVYEIVSKAIARANLVKRSKGPHLLRHTGATLRALRGDGIEKIRVWLDHKSYTMSKRYVHAAERLRQESVENELLKDKGKYRK